MELEEAVKYLKNINDKDLWIKGYVYGTEAIETILKALENSISKDKIKERIQDLKLSGGSDGKDLIENKIRDITIEILEELMEDKQC